jgi:hypothetical protein
MLGAQKKRAPCSGALSRYGDVSPRLIAAACPASWPASGFPEENLCPYFFFFLPAFFFILVFNFGLDFFAELFFLTGIDTSLTVAAAGQAPKPPEPLASRCWSRLQGRIIETRYSKIKKKADHL